MGSKFPGCFPRGRRWRRNSKTGKQEPPAGASSEEPEPKATRTRSTPSTSSETEAAESGRAYFSSKARVSFRHQLDSERDATT
ncbi:uncharacterized protein C17orf114 homolog [Pogona vitticeps]|uniref:Uncharacterized protein C17orf114 homolog n=1 Tax=Pogona vitticeps TaxID=103695 RepID=A0ABM5EJV2_9SAUR